MEIVDLALCLLDKGTQRDMEIFFGVAWMIWYNRNQIVHEGIGVSEDHIWETAIQMIKEFKGIGGWEINSNQRSEKVWTPPPVGFFKINVDGAVPSVDGHSGVGVVIRDWERKVIAAKKSPSIGSNCSGGNRSHCYGTRNDISKKYGFGKNHF